MKKTTSKLALRKTTLRALGAELSAVRGGDGGAQLTRGPRDLAPPTARCTEACLAR